MSENVPTTSRMKSNIMLDDVNSLELVFGLSSATSAIRLKTKTIRLFGGDHSDSNSTLLLPIITCTHFLLLHLSIRLSVVWASFYAVQSLTQYDGSMHQQSNTCIFDHLLFNSLYPFMMSDVRTSAERCVLIFYGCRCRGSHGTTRLRVRSMACRLINAHQSVRKQINARNK